jgi:hypothetical protein
MAYQLAHHQAHGLTASWPSCHVRYFMHVQVVLHSGLGPAQEIT